MPAKKASKLKRKSSSSTLTKYSRSRPLGPELKWFDVNTPNTIVGFGLATLIQAQHCPFLALDRTSVSVVPSWSKKSKSRSTCKQLGPMSEPQSLQPLASVIVSISFWTSKRGGALGADIYDTLVAGVSPENRFMNLLNSDRFSLVKRWEGDINPPSFIVPDATSSTLIVGRDLRLKKKCSIRVELTPNAAPTILDVKSNNLLLVFFIQSKRWWCTRC